MKTTTARASLVILLLCLPPRVIYASPIQLNFGGTVNAVEDPFGLIGSLVAVGDPILANVRYDTTTPDLFSADPTRGTYLSPGWLTLDINGLAFEHRSGVQVDVLHNFNGNEELFQAMVCCGTGGFGNPTAWPASLPLFSHYRLLLQIGETTLPPALLSSDALPPSLDLALADFARGQVSSGTSDRAMYNIHFQLTSVPEPVPEPGTLALFSAGLALGLSRYRASRGHRDTNRAPEASQSTNP
jgi:hypothetical protein